MIKAELIEIKFDENIMTFKCQEPMVVSGSKYILIEEKEFEKLSKASCVSGGKIPTKLILTSNEIELPIGSCEIKGRVTFNNKI